MVSPQNMREYINVRLKRVLAAAELVVPPERYGRFRKIVLDEFGRNGLLGDLERETDNRERHG